MASPHAQSQQVQDGGNENKEISEVIVNNATLVRGSGNIISTPQMDNEKIASLVSASQTREVPKTKPSKITFTVNCGTTVVGDRNIIGHTVSVPSQMPTQTQPPLAVGQWMGGISMPQQQIGLQQLHFLQQMPMVHAALPQQVHTALPQQVHAVPPQQVRGVLPHQVHGVLPNHHMPLNAGQGLQGGGSNNGVKRQAEDDGTWNTAKRR